MTEPTQPSPSKEELNIAIAEATRAYIKIATTYPRDAARIAAARATINDLVALRDSLYP